MGFLFPWDRRESFNLGAMFLGEVPGPESSVFLGPSPDLSIVCPGLVALCVMREQEAVVACEPVKWIAFLLPLYPAPGKRHIQLFLSFWGGEEELRVERQDKSLDSPTRRPKTALVPSPHVPI